MAKADEKEKVAAEETAAEEESQSKKAPKPDGYVSPIEYAEHRSQLLGRLIRPQTIYSNIRNVEGFPVEKNEDGRYMIHQETADKWYEDREKAKAERKAAKEKAAKESDKEAVAEDS